MIFDLDLMTTYRICLSWKNAKINDKMIHAIDLVFVFMLMWKMYGKDTSKVWFQDMIMVNKKDFGCKK